MCWLTEAQWHMYESVVKTIIDPVNGLRSVQIQVITWLNADLLLIGSLGINFREI